MQNSIIKTSTITTSKFSEYTSLKGIATINDKNEMNVEWFLFNHLNNKSTQKFELDYFNIRYDVDYHLQMLSNDFKEYCKNNDLDLTKY
tara:strand:- start:740 stop:1006 length:267 start_codon:yes stop_codon:yes gene_type:complete